MVDNIGGKNGIEFIKEAIDLFKCIIYPIDTEIGFILLKISINEVKRLLDINIILIMSSLLLAQ